MTTQFLKLALQPHQVDNETSISPFGFRKVF